MMDYLPLLCPGNFSVNPFPPPSPTATLSLRVKSHTVRPISLFKSWIGCWFWKLKCRALGVGNISTPQLGANRHITDLLLVGVQRISMAAHHLVVPHAHFFCGNRAFTKLASPSNNPAAPFIFGRAMSLYALVVHKAKSIGGVLASAFFNRASSVCFVCSHSHNITNREQKYYVLGNSMAVPCIAWIGRRIEAVVRRLEGSDGG